MYRIDADLGRRSLVVLPHGTATPAALRAAIDLGSRADDFTVVHLLPGPVVLGVAVGFVWHCEDFDWRGHADELLTGALDQLAVTAPARVRHLGGAATATLRTDLLGEIGGRTYDVIILPVQTRGSFWVHGGGIAERWLKRRTTVPVVTVPGVGRPSGQLTSMTATWSSS